MLYLGVTNFQSLCNLRKTNHVRQREREREILEQPSKERDGLSAYDGEIEKDTCRDGQTVHDRKIEKDTPRDRHNRITKRRHK